MLINYTTPTNRVIARKLSDKSKDYLKIIETSLTLKEYFLNRNLI